MTAIAARQASPMGNDERFYISMPVSILEVEDRRLDAETYLTGGYGIRAELTGTFPCEPLGRVAHVWQPPRLAGINVAPEYGIPFLAATQVFDLRPMGRRHLAPSRTPDLERRFVREGWILVTCSGSVGDAMMVYRPLEGKIVSHDLLRVVVDDVGLRMYLYAFMRTRQAREMARSTKYGSIVKHLEVEHLQAIPVPDLGSEVRERTGRLIAEAFRLRNGAVALSDEAEARFGAHFDVRAVQQMDEMEATFEVGLGELLNVGRRLDAHYYNPQARTAAAVLRDGAREVVALGATCEDIFGVPRFKHVYGGSGIPYLDSEDLFKVNAERAKFIPHVTKRDAERYFVERDSVLMASSGQIYGVNGRVVLATEAHERAIISNHVVRIVPKSVDGAYLVTALGHPVLGRPLVLRAAFGSEVPELAPTDIARFPLARLADDEEAEISAIARRASESWLEADRCENAAVAYLERFIEGTVRGEDDSERSRAAYHAAAYALVPPTPEEGAWAVAGADGLLRVGEA